MIFDRKQQLTVCLNQGRLVGWIRAVGGCTTFGGGTVKNTLKRDGAENRGGDKLVQGVGALKRGGGGAGAPLRTVDGEFYRKSCLLEMHSYLGKRLAIFLRAF